MTRTLMSIMAFLFLAGAAEAEIDTASWSIEKSEHFILYYKEAPIEYVKEVLDKSEKYYNSITDDIGFTRFDGFWTWDKRAKIYLFTNAQEYQKITKSPGWSGGGVNIGERRIYTFVNMKNFFDVILPHEIGHIVFREFIGNDRKVPLWMDEGVACYLEKAERPERLRIARGLVRSKLFMPLDELQEVNRLYILIMPDVFYAESASVIEFLISVYGKDKFVEFCRRLRDLRGDQGWEVALADVYKFKDISELNARWMNFLFESDGQRT